MLPFPDSSVMDFLWTFGNVSVHSNFSATPYTAASTSSLQNSSIYRLNLGSTNLIAWFSFSTDPSSEGHYFIFLPTDLIFDPTRRGPVH